MLIMNNAILTPEIYSISSGLLLAEEAITLDFFNPYSNFRLTIYFAAQFYQQVGGAFVHHASTAIKIKN